MCFLFGVRDPGKFEICRDPVSNTLNRVKIEKKKNFGIFEMI